MLLTNKFTIVNPNEPLVKVLERMTKFGIGHCCIIDEQAKLVGVFTDGDLRRLILSIQKPLPALLLDEISKHMSTNPKTVFADSLALELKNTMLAFNIWDLPVVNRDNKLIGLIHMSSIL